MDEVPASPATLERSTGAGEFAPLIVCGTSVSPLSFSSPSDAYAVTRDRYGSFTEAMPFTPMNELLGGSVRRPRAGVAEMSVARNGLSKMTEVTSLWNQDPV